MGSGYVLVALAIALFFELILHLIFGGGLGVLTTSIIIFFGYWIILELYDMKNLIKNEPEKTKSTRKNK